MDGNPRTAGSLMEPKRVLAMQTGGWLGDMVLLSPALKALREQWPEAEIALMVRPLVAEFMSHHPCVDHLLVYDKRGADRGWRALNRWARAISGSDIAIVWHPTSIRSAFLPWLAGIPVRVGSRFNGRGILLTHSCANRTNIHEVERYLQVLEAIQVSPNHAELYYWHGASEQAFVEDWLERQGVDRSVPLVAVHLGTTWETKRWPAERFTEVVNTIVNRKSCQVVLVGSSDGHEHGNTFRERVAVPYIDGVGRLDLLQFGALMEHCATLLTCDSGPMHIAAAVGIPVVGLFGPTSPQRHRPYGEGHTVLRHEISCGPCYRRVCPHAHECMTQIGVGEVVEAITTKLPMRV